ncbi:AraC family transcriptional regulator [Ancylomarina sp. 16SWW S1-10-2]|uniref:helix-turn-helix domain-containing protein n=1 Tax=Ancylomarina sp. 16SWW S1-10-2 TaxID=2499681 RepID=UPI0012AD392F|nr:response regulator transcription factor [Ancylomarina sp. 16SWW S1-10-2]MRT92819.1 AraC family transcriptional regulator [Ancylomarina sp. 16SWW S1-10-2]
MEIYDNVKTYFLNNNDDINDYSNRFYIKSISERNINEKKPDDKYLEPHKRDFFEIAILARHTKKIRIGEQTFNKMTNGLAIVSPFQTISYGKNKEDDNDEGYVINFKTSIFENLNQTYEVQNQFPFFKIHTLPLYYLTKDDFAEILPIAAEMYREATSNKMHSLEIIRSLLLVFLYKIKRITKNNEGIISMNRYDAIMSKFEQIILSNDNTFLSVNEYASKMNISPIYLTECVKKATGKSAQKIIIDYKILYAQTLLHQEEKSIADIADSLGFNEAANFNQFFKRNTGITASQFRKKQRIV